MLRIPLVSADVAGDVADAVRERRGGHLEVIDRVLLHSPPVAEGWNAFYGNLRDHTVLSGDVREIAILRTAYILRNDHTWKHHVPLALAEGVSAEKIEAIRAPEVGPGFSPSELLAIEYADAMTMDVHIPAELTARVRKHFSDRETIELTVSIAGYNLVTRFLLALGIGDVDDWVEPTTDGES